MNRLEHTIQAPNTAVARRYFLGVPFDLADVDAVMDALHRRTQADAFAYVVTPNVDHVVRLDRSPQLLDCYRSAWMSWCDSRPLRRLARLRGIAMPLLAGSDMTERIFAQVLRSGDRLACITADDALLDAMRAAFPDYEIVGYSPPPGFDDNPGAFEQCVDFIVRNPARFVFIGIGSPRSERIARAVLRTGQGRGTALCIGASLEFMTGRKKRAPRAIRRLGLEWLHRMLSEPGRLWRRYVFAVVPLAKLFARDVLTRR